MARAQDGLAARVAEAGLAEVQVRPGHGGTLADWENLGAWFRGRPGAASRVATLGRDAVDAVRTLTQNLTRLSRSGLGGSSRRADYLRLAGWFDEAARERPRGAASAGRGGVRDIRQSSSRVRARRRGRSGAVGNVLVGGPARTCAGEFAGAGRHHEPRPVGPGRRPVPAAAALLARRRAEEETIAAARAELLAAVALDGALADGTALSTSALRALQRLLGPAVAAMGPVGEKGEAEIDGMRCIVERRAGESTAVSTPAGTLVLRELADHCLVA